MDSLSRHFVESLKGKNHLKDDDDGGFDAFLTALYALQQGECLLSFRLVITGQIAEQDIRIEKAQWQRRSLVFRSHIRGHQLLD